MATLFLMAVHVIFETVTSRIVKPFRDVTVGRDGCNFLSRRDL